MTPDELRFLGRALYGERWRIPLATELGVDTRTVRNWLAGKHPINKRTAAALRSLRVKKSRCQSRRPRA